MLDLAKIGVLATLNLIGQIKNNHQAIFILDKINRLLQQEAQYISHHQLATIDTNQSHQFLMTLILNTYKQNNLYERLTTFLDQLIYLEVRDFTVYFELGFCYLCLEKYNLAIYYFQKSITYKKDIPPFINISLCYQKLRFYYLSIYYAKIGLKIDDSSTDLLRLIAGGYGFTGDTFKAIFYYEKLHNLQPNHSQTSFNLALFYLSINKYKKGWLLYESRFKLYSFEKKFHFLNNQKQYNHQCLINKTLLLHYEQGMGDILQFARFIPLVQKKQPRKIIFLIADDLVSLFQDSFKNIQIISKQKEIPSYDYHCSLMSLPYIFHLDKQDILMKNAYLFPKATIFLPVNHNQFNIGIVWKSGIAPNKTKKRKNTSLKMFHDILSLAHTQVYSLQSGEWSSQIKEQGLENKIIDTSLYFTDLNATASFIKQLDLIITIATTTTHLAGALHKKCFVLLPNHRSWRWGIEENSCIWYPSLTLFRRRKKEEKTMDFTKVMQEIYTQTALLIKEKPQLYSTPKVKTI